MGRSSNDDRSDTLNPNNESYWAAQANQAGDDNWDDGDDAADPGPMCEMHLHPTEIKLGDVSTALKGSVRQQLGALVIDRQSHFLRSFLSLLDAIWGPQFETPESVQARSTMATTQIAKAQEDLLQAEKAHRSYKPGYNDYGNKICEETARQQKAQLTQLAQRAQEHLEFERKSEWKYENGLWKWRLPNHDCLEHKPTLKSVGWRDLTEWLDHAMISAMSNHNGDQPFGIYFDVRLPPEHSPPEDSPCPAIVEAKGFESNEELFQTTRELKVAFRGDGYPGSCRIARPILFPRTEATGDMPSITHEQISLTLNAIQWLLRPCVDSWDIRPIMKALINAATAAEWAEASYCIFGVKFGWNETCVSDFRCAKNSKTARLIHDGFVERGFRTVVLETPIVTGQLSWAKSAENVEFWMGGGPSNDPLIPR